MIGRNFIVKNAENAYKYKKFQTQNVSKRKKNSPENFLPFPRNRQNTK